MSPPHTSLSVSLIFSPPTLDPLFFSLFLSRKPSYLEANHSLGRLSLDPLKLKADYMRLCLTPSSGPLCGDHQTTRLLYVYTFCHVPFPFYPDSASHPHTSTSPEVYSHMRIPTLSLILSHMKYAVVNARDYRNGPLLPYLLPSLALPRCVHEITPVA